ncbi:MAG TPA: serine/threonine-protein kinase [Kofleriaceae bacterium]|nr:serine/threonine-protein kinase [Kofleriaceae bacterium]
MGVPSEPGGRASLVGVTLGNYVVERELGRGGMGAVYIGTHPVIGRRVAIKVLQPQFGQRADLVQRFFTEARAASAIHHPGIVEIYDFGTAPDGSSYLVMEYLQGESLATRLRTRGMLAIPVAVAIARQTANALAAAHRIGIVHRDLKPDNIFIVPDPEVAIGERVKLLDFGVAKLVDPTGGAGESPVQTVTGALLGTPHYMSPEQCEGARAIDARSDLYSLGCVLFQMVTGRLPFESPGIGGVIGAHLHVPPPALRQLAPHARPALEAIVARLLAKQPEHRFQSADELASALTAPEASSTDASHAPASAPIPAPIDAHAPTMASISTAPPPRTEPQAPRRMTKWLVLSGGLATVAVVIAVWAMNRDKHEGDRGRDTGSSSHAMVHDALTVEPDAAGLAQSPAVPPVTAKPPPSNAPLRTVREQQEAALAGSARQPAKQQHLEQMLDADRNGRLDEAAYHARRIYALGDPGDPMRAQADEILQRLGTTAIPQAELRLKKLVGAHRCEAARALVTHVEELWGKSLDPLASRCERDTRTAAADRYVALFQAYAATDFGLAFELCHRTPPSTHTTALDCIVAACRVHDDAQRDAWIAQFPTVEKQAMRLCSPAAE